MRSLSAASGQTILFESNLYNLRFSVAFQGGRAGYFGGSRKDSRGIDPADANRRYLDPMCIVDSCSRRIDLCGSSQVFLVQCADRHRSRGCQAHVSNFTRAWNYVKISEFIRSTLPSSSVGLFLAPKSDTKSAEERRKILLETVQLPPCWKLCSFLLYVGRVKRLRKQGRNFPPQVS